MPHNDKLNQAPIHLLPNFGAGWVQTHYLDMAMLTLFNTEEQILEDYVKLVEVSGFNLIKVWDLGETSLLELAA